MPRPNPPAAAQGAYVLVDEVYFRVGISAPVDRFAEGLLRLGRALDEQSR